MTARYNADLETLRDVVAGMIESCGRDVPLALRLDLKQVREGLTDAIRRRTP